jgi:hypothetical protein
MWMAFDGRRFPQEKLGDYGYLEPHEAGHDNLIEDIRKLGCNFICHDSVMHRRTECRWPTDNTHTPVDWRFWLALKNSGFQFKTIDAFGEEAYVPGTWRHGISVDQVLVARTFDHYAPKEEKVAEKQTKKRSVKAERRMRNVEKILYARNVSDKEQVIMGGKKCVKKGETVPVEDVTMPNGQLYPGFVYDDTIDMNVPDMDETGDPIPDIESPLLTGEVLPEAKTLTGSKRRKRARR